LKTFREAAVPRGQVQMFPRTLDEYVPPDAKVRVVSDLIDSLDLSWLQQAYGGGGRPSYHPIILLKMMVFAYFEGLRSSRRIALALDTDVRFMWLSEGERPDHRTLCRFRARHAKAFERVFVETVHLCQRLGLVPLAHVAVDGTKIEANASTESTHFATTIGTRLQKVEDRIAQILREAEAVDAAEDAAFGDSRGDEIPEELRDAERRKERLEQVRREMEQEGLRSLVETDRDARVMRTSRGIRPAYNAQAAVDGEAQVIVAVAVVQAEVDRAELPAVMEQVHQNTGGMPDHLTADAGYHSKDTETYIEEQSLDAYIPPARNPARSTRLWEAMTYDEAADVYRHADGRVFKFYREETKDRRAYRVYRCKQSTILRRLDGESTDRMRAKLRTREGRAIFALRRQTVEPVFGRLKETLGLRRFLLRGLTGAGIEFRLACIAHNLAKAVKAVQGQPAIA
jgi:transposase